ncbi:MAG: SagB/ThcOx family dehydrogenase [candidate division KSB1 bacterium]|nr:SagB/ThcOx family dehydrogenase [candidate division KSB1 bacterium]
MIMQTAQRFLMTALFISAITLTAQELAPIPLPAPQTDSTEPLMQALKTRHSTRSFKPDTLSTQMLGDLCWAAFGISRPESGKRTAPSAMNRQEIDVYVALQKGLYLYNAKAHQLQPVVDKDLRAETGTQDYTGKAPVNLVYVADLSKMGDGSIESKLPYAYADTGFIGENVYLFCAAKNLGTVVRGSIDRETLGPLMKLRRDQKIILAQTLGYPDNSPKDKSKE